MKLKMAENSLFAILLRNPWWISIAIAAVAGLGMTAMLPSRFSAVGFTAGLPFFVIGVIAFFKQIRAPSAARIAHMRDTVSAMSWRDFSAALEAAYQRDGYAVDRHAAPAADFRVTREGRSALVSAKRWKAASIGVEPLRELKAAAETAGAQESIFIAIGQLSDNARVFAREKNVRVLQDAELAKLLQGMVAKTV